MKLKFPVTEHVKAELLKHGVRRGASVKVRKESYDMFLKSIHAGGYSHLSEEQKHALAIGCCMTHPDHRNKHRRIPRYWYWLVFGLGLLLLLGVAARAQGTSQIDVITFQNSSGVNIKSFAAPFKIKCSTNVTCAAAGSTLTITAAAGGAGGYATIQNAGVAIAQEPILNFLGALACVDDAANTRSNCQITANIAVAHKFVTGIDASGNLTRAQVASTDLSDFSVTAPSHTGQLPIYDQPSGTYIPGDPIMSGPDANGAAPAGNPLMFAGWDGTNVRRIKTDTAGVLQVNLSGLAVACAGLPALTGDVTSSSGSCATTLAKNPLTGTFSPTGTTGLPALTGSPGWIVQGTFPTDIAFYCGPGSGHNCKFLSRTGGVDTTEVTINDTAPNLVPQSLSVPGLTTLSTLNVSSYIFVDSLAGADAGAKWNACDTAMISLGGGVCNGTALTGAQSAAASINMTANQTRHLFGDSTYTLAANPGINYTAQGGSVEGASEDNTVFQTSSATADTIKVSSIGAKSHFSDFLLSSTVTRTAGNCLHVQGGSNTFERVQIFPCWNGINLDTNATGGNNTFDYILIGGGGSGAAWNCGVTVGGIATGNVASNSFSHIAMQSSGPAFADSQFCIRDGTDSLTISDSQIVANVGGADATGLHFSLVAAGNPPSNIRISNLTVEGGLTKPGIIIDSAFGVEFTGSTIQSSLQGLLVNAGTRVSWKGGLFYNNQQEGARLNNVAAVDLSIQGVRFCNNGLATNNTFSDFFAVANSTGFSLIGNRFLACNAGGNAPKDNIEIAAGTTNNATIALNSFSGSVGAAILNGATGTANFICNLGAGCSFDNFANKYGQADIVADSAAINTTDTIIVKSPALVANRAIAGTHFRITLTGTCTSTVANTSTFTIRWGTTGTTADGTIAALVSSVAAASGTNNGFRTVIDLTVRTGGASATSSAFMELISDGNIGIVATPNEKFVAGTAFNTTTANAILSVSYKSAANTTTTTFKNATIEIVQN